jgi:hypothetical protein
MVHQAVQQPLHCAANFQEAEGRFLRLWAWLDTGGAADFAWRHPDMHREQAPEVADILIANRPGDLGHVECGRQHQPLGQLRAPGNHVLVWRKTHAGLETARKMERAEMHLRGQIFEGELGAQILFDEAVSLAT